MHHCVICKEFKRLGKCSLWNMRCNLSEELQLSVAVHPGKFSEHFCELFAVWKYCRSNHIKVISLVIPYNTRNSCRPDNQRFPGKLALNLMGDGEPLTLGLLQGISIRCITTVVSLSIGIVFVCCVAWYLGLDEALSPLRFAPDCVGLSMFWWSRHKAERCDRGCLPTSDTGTVQCREGCLICFCAVVSFPVMVK